MSQEANQKPTNMIMVGLLVVAAFFVGTLWQKVQMLEKGGSTTKPSAATAQPAPSQNAPQKETIGDIPAVSDQDHIKGNQKKAKVTLVEYSDFECPFCKRFHPTMEKILSEYGDKVAWVFRHYPLSFHESAMPLARASECVNDMAGNDGFWKFADKVYTIETLPKTEDEIVQLVANLGFDQATFKTCYESNKFDEKINGEQTAGANAGIKGTPGTVVLVGDKQVDFISGALPYAQVKSVVDKYIK